MRTHPQRPHLTLLTDADTEETLDYATLARAAEGDRRQVAGARRATEPDSGHHAADLSRILHELLRRARRRLSSGADLSAGARGPDRGSPAPPRAYPGKRARRGSCSPCPRRARCSAPAAVSRHELGFIIPPTNSRVPGGGAALRAADIARLQYTSGSTGSSPKGVILTHANLLANIRAMGGTVRATSTDVFVSWMPLYHDMGLIGALAPAASTTPSARGHVAARVPRAPEHWLWAIHRHRATISGATSATSCACGTSPTTISRARPLLGRLAFNGAEPVS